MLWIMMYCFDDKSATIKQLAACLRLTKMHDGGVIRRLKMRGCRDTPIGK